MSNVVVSEHSVLELAPADVGTGKQCKETAESTTPLTINIVSRASGKPAIAQAANVLVGRGAGRKISFSIDVKELNSIIEGTAKIHRNSRDI